MEINIYSIYEDEFFERLEAVNKRAMKKGLPQLTATTHRERNDDNRLVTIIQMDDYLPQFDNWKMLAAIDFIGGEMLVRNAPNREAVRSELTNDPKRCDHCQTRHPRKYAFQIQHKDGTLMQIGKSCLADFLGKNAATMITDFWLEDFVASYGNLSDPDDMGFGRFPKHLNLFLYLSYVKLSIDAYGWCSRTKAREHNEYAIDRFLTPTADHAHVIMWKDKARREAEYLAKNNKSRTHFKIKDAIEWAKEQSGNDYLETIASIARLDIVPMKYDGFAASILSAYNRHLEYEREKAEQRKNAENAPKGRVTVTGKIISFKEKSTAYGFTMKMIALTDQGWKLYVMLPSAISEAEVGNRVEMVVTVTPSDNDPLFAFGKRPSKAKILD